MEASVLLRGRSSCWSVHVERLLEAPGGARSSSPRIRQVDVNGIKYATLNYAVGTEQYLDENGQRVDLTEKIKDPGKYKYFYHIFIQSS